MDENTLVEMRRMLEETPPSPWTCVRRVIASVSTLKPISGIDPNHVGFEVGYCGPAWGHFLVLADGREIMVETSHEDEPSDLVGFIAAARTALPALLDEVERLRTLLAKVYPAWLRRVAANVDPGGAACEDVCPDAAGCVGWDRGRLPCEGDAAALRSLADELEAGVKQGG